MTDTYPSGESIIDESEQLTPGQVLYEALMELAPPFPLKKGEVLWYDDIFEHDHRESYPGTSYDFGFTQKGKRQNRRPVFVLTELQEENDSDNSSRPIVAELTETGEVTGPDGGVYDESTILEVFEDYLRGLKARTVYLHEVFINEARRRRRHSVEKKRRWATGAVIAALAIPPVLGGAIGDELHEGEVINATNQVAVATAQLESAENNMENILGGLGPACASEIEPFLAGEIVEGYSNEYAESMVKDTGACPDDPPYPVARTKGYEREVITTRSSLGEAREDLADKDNFGIKVAITATGVFIGGIVSPLLFVGGITVNDRREERRR